MIHVGQARPNRWAWPTRSTTGFSNPGTQPRGQYSSVLSPSAETSLASIELKVIIEQIREQVQNLE